MPKTAVTRAFVFATAFLGVIPFLPYGWARLTGHLPSESTWDRQGGNHGPWWSTPWEGVVMGPLLALVVFAALTLLTGIILSVRRRVLCLAQWVALCGVQLALAFLQLDALFWTID